MEKYGGRQVAFSAVVGSHNYKLNTPKSDMDIKVFVLPTFEDLYKGNMHSESVVGEHTDYDVHDVRKLSHLFYKANVNFLEVLYTTQFGFGGNGRLFGHVNKVFDMKDEIVTMNLPYLFNACGGMYKNKMKAVEKGTESTQYLVEEFGYDTKQLMSAYRIINFIVRFHATQFKDFKKAMTYDDKLQHGVMMSMKNGEWPKHEALNYVQTYHDKFFVPLKEVYHEQPVREDVREKLDSVIMQMVKEEVCK
jgi:uncharacterized protein